MSLAISLALATTLAGPFEFLRDLGSVVNDGAKSALGATATVVEDTADAVGAVAEVGGEAVAKVSDAVVEELASPKTLIDLTVIHRRKMSFLSFVLDALLGGAVSDLAGELPSVRKHRK